jgi:hypothetical protein
LVGTTREAQGDAAKQHQTEHFHRLTMMLHLLASTQHESSPLHWHVNFALRFLLKLLSSLAILLSPRRVSSFVD